MAASATARFLFASRAPDAGPDTGRLRLAGGGQDADGRDVAGLEGSFHVAGHGHHGVLAGEGQPLLVELGQERGGGGYLAGGGA
jgi:hypothetical protein